MSNQPNLEEEIEELETKAKSTFMTLLTNVKVVIGAVVTVISLVTALGLLTIDTQRKTTSKTWKVASLVSFVPNPLTPV